MSSTPDTREALEAIERILDRGGDADEVLRAVLEALHERGVGYAGICFAERDELVDGPWVGAEPARTAVPVLYDGKRVGVLELATDDRAFAERVATLNSAYVLVGWDTAGEPWAP